MVIQLSPPCIIGIPYRINDHDDAIALQHYKETMNNALCSISGIPTGHPSILAHNLAADQCRVPLLLG